MSTTYIDKMFHFYKTIEDYEMHHEYGLINPDSICFISDTGQIATNNKILGVSTKLFEEFKESIESYTGTINTVIDSIHYAINNVKESLNTSNNVIDSILDRIPYLESESISTDTLLNILDN